MWLERLALASLVAGATAVADEPWRFDLRYHAAPNRDNRLDETALSEVTLAPHLTLDFGARLEQTGSDLRTFSYKGEIAWAPLSFAKAAVRLFHTVDLPDTTAETDVLPVATLEGFPLSSVGAFVSVGWYFRFDQLTKASVLPTPWRSSFFEQDFALQVGVHVRPVEQWLATVRLATFEPLDVFNLNHPFAEVALEYHPKDASWAAMAYGRYQILLGFGRLDEMLFGVGLVLNPPGASGS